MPQARAKIFAFSRSLLISGGLVVALSVTFALYVISEKEIDQANENRLNSYLLSDELRQSSDDLTRMVRTHVATGNPIYKQYYQEILDIRNGLKPRPQDYHRTYWDLVNGQKRPRSSGAAVSLISLMRQSGFTAEEFSKLSEAHAESDRLTRVELEAMQLVEQASPQNQASRTRALELVFSQSYQQSKAAIMRPIDEFAALMERRTGASVRTHEMHATVYRILFVALGIGLIISLWQTYRQMRGVLGTSLGAIHAQVSRLGRGDFSDNSRDNAANPDSVLGHLVEARRLLRNIEEERHRVEAGRRLMARIFDASSEGIMITNEGGTIENVNEAFVAMTGYSREEAVGKTPRILRSDHHDEAFYHSMWDTLKHEGQWRGEIWNRKKSGELHVGILSISRIENDQGKISRYISLFTDITPLKQQQQQAEQLAHHDALTQLPNRLLLSDRIQQALARSKRSEDSVAVICLDLDGFKAVNDTLGHDAGDNLLIEVASRLTGCVRTDDTVARLGGDEFVVLLCGLSSPEDCEATICRMLEDLTLPFSLAGNVASISGSIGYTMFPDDDADADTLMRHADQAMYAAKQAGKNRFHRFDLSQDNRTKANWGAIARIEKALKQNEFRLYVQPKIELSSGKVMGAEALIRWIHPIRGLVPPMEFLPLIEEEDISIQLGEWVIKEGLRLLKVWNEQGLEVKLSVNVNARQLREKNFTCRLEALLKDFPDVLPRHLEIEIVESAALDDMQKVSQLITRCQALGVDFALDDFGTGYSSLTYLRRLSANTLKIDQTFVRDMLVDGNDFAIVRGVIGLAQAFGSTTVAEGVETWPHASILLGLGCDIAQGYAIARPMPDEEFPGWVKNFQMPDIKGVLNP